MAQSNLNGVAETDPGYGEIFAILLRQRVWFVGVFCLVLAFATVRALKQAPVYKSSLQLLVEPTYQGKNQGVMDAYEQFADSNIEIDNVTQLALMQSSHLLQKAVDLLRPKYPYISVEEIKGSLAVYWIEDKKVAAKIVEVTYVGNDPVKTQNVLQAIQEVYKQYNREQQQLRLTRGLAFIDEQLPKARQSVAQAQAALEKFRTDQNLVNPESQAQALSNEINKIQQDRRTIQAQYQELESRYKILQQQIASSPQKAIIASRLSQSSRYQGLLNEIQKIELELAKQRLRFTDENPIIQNLLTQRQDLQALLQQEAERSLQQSVSPTNLMTDGQLGSSDLQRASALLEVQTNLLGSVARDRALAEKEQELRTQLNEFPKLLGEYDRLQPDIQLKRTTLQQLEKARQELSLEIARGGFDWQIVEAPQLGKPSSSQTKQNILIGAVVGLMLAGVAAFARDTVDDSIHNPDQLKQQVSLPILGKIPESSKIQKEEPIIKLPFGQPPALAPLTVQVLYWPPAWESLDLVYKNIQLQNPSSSLHTLAVTSALADQGKSTLALGLAISAARLHQRVLLIDADLRSPSLHKLLNLPNEWGISNLIESDTILARETPISSSNNYSDIYIDILTVGSPSIDPVHVLSSKRMQKLLLDFQQYYDLVLLNSPSVLGKVDAILVASLCQGVVLVERIGKVSKTELSETITMLNKSNLLGIVLNTIQPTSFWQRLRKKAP